MMNQNLRSLCFPSFLLFLHKIGQVIIKPLLFDCLNNYNEKFSTTSSFYEMNVCCYNEHTKTFFFDLRVHNTCDCHFSVFLDDCTLSCFLLSSSMTRILSTNDRSLCFICLLVLASLILKLFCLTTQIFLQNIFEKLFSIA